MRPTMLTNHFKLHLSNAKGVAGFSLVELMVSITIGLFLLLGLATLLLNSTSTHTEMQKSSAQIENGRYATQLLSEDIRLAGYYGEYSPTGYNVPEKPCAAAVTPVAPNMPSPIGYDLTSTGTDFSCMTNLQSGTGVLVLRRVQTVTATADAVNTYLQVSQCNSDATTTLFKFGTVASTGGFNLRKIDCVSTNPAALRKFVVHIYYISSCNVCAPTADGIPTLKMVEYVDGAAQTPVALVEGIEDMQLDYGIDASNDGSPDSYVADTDTTSTTRLVGTPTNWANVMAVRINLLARNITPTNGYDDSKTYALGLAKPTYTVPTGVARTYKRHAYSTLVRVENPSARRESP